MVVRNLDLGQHINIYISIIILPIISLLPPATATTTPIISNAGPGCTMLGLPLLNNYNATLKYMQLIVPL
jgi:hypothetical protein